MPATDRVAAYLAAREALIADAVPGGAAARALSDLTDAAVADIAAGALAGLDRPWALLALGGWGARRLLPGSDLDLLVVTDAPAPRLLPALQSVLYPLWDAGLTLGHQVRSERDNARAVREDLATLTSVLTGRALCGDGALGERVIAAAAADASRRRKRVLPLLDSRARPGSPYLLEPDLKEGAGGQRDLDELVWRAAVIGGRPSSEPGVLLTLGLLSETDASSIEVAAERITAARWALQAAGARPASLLTLEAADEMGADAQALQESLADVHHILLRVRERKAPAGRGGQPGPAGPPRPGAREPR